MSRERKALSVYYITAQRERALNEHREDDIANSASHSWVWGGGAHSKTRVGANDGNRLLSDIKNKKY